LNAGFVLPQIEQLMIKGTIWWDCDGTLVSRPLMWSEAGCRFLDRFASNHQVSQERLRKALRTGHFPATECHPELTPDLWWESVRRRYSEAFRELGCPLANGRETLFVIRDDILDACRYSVFDDVVLVLERLNRSGWRHVMVSNHVPELDEIVAALGIGEFFHAVLTSAIVGYEKPHARMFEAALEQTVPGAPVWMVGDSVEADCVPATSFGANAILVRTDTPFERRAPDLWAALDMIES
jgi:putative hydrolase of the HAD superfamily